MAAELDTTTAQDADASSENFRYIPAAYGIMHALIDATTVTTIFRAVSIHDLGPFAAFYYVVGYDLLAFATQVFLGAAVDRFRSARGAVLTGITASALGMVFLRIEPYSALVLAGLGNAVFHLGAGAFSLNAERGRAAPPGIFVGPGALGLGFGMWMGKSGPDITWPFFLALAAAFLIAILIRNPVIRYDILPRKLKIARPNLILFLLLFSVAVRAFVGGAGGYEVPRAAMVSFGLAFAAFAGKSLGGILSDRLGWIETSVGALLLSAPLLAFGGPNHYLVTVGMFLFQMTMPVTLVAIASLFPARPAFSFGLACLALIAGALPTYFHAVKEYYSSPGFLVLILLSTAAVYLGLRLLKKEVPMKFTSSRETPQ